MLEETSLLILYGTETGTAQDVAETIRREAILQKIPVRVSDVADFSVDRLPYEKFVVFVVSTAGQGEFPPDALPFWRLLLRKSLPSTWLEQTNYAVFGLGDSSYQKFNFAGKKLFRRLKNLGAHVLTDLGLGDDQHDLGYDFALSQFKLNLWAELHKKNVFKNSIANFDPSVILPPKYYMIYSEDGNGIVRLDDYHPLELQSNERVTAQDHFQDTRLFSFKVNDWTQYKYRPGDVLMICPYNLPESVSLAIESLNPSTEQLDRPFILNATDESTKMPPAWLIGNPSTLRTCFERYFDLQMIPKRSFFESLGHLSQDPMEKEKLLELASPEGLDDYLDYCVRCRRTIAEALQDFPATAKNLPVEYYFDVFRPIRPRAFSIASSMVSNPDIIQILVAKVEYKSRMSTARKGLCSSFLSRLKPGNKVFCKIRAGTFRFPESEKSVICVGPGTGVAPFRSYLNERFGCTELSILFFGCRSAKKDFYFESEWRNMSWTSVFPAFSRDAEEKQYVQHRIVEQHDIIWKILGEENGYCFVAGSSGDMPKGVMNSLNDVAKKHGFTGESFVDYLERTGRIQFETWS